MYFYTSPQDNKSKKRSVFKVVLVLLAAFLIFEIGMHLGQYYENIPAGKDEVKKFSDEVFKTNNPALIEELKGFTELFPSPSEKQLNSFKAYFEMRKNNSLKPVALPESEASGATHGVTINSPGVDYQSLAVSATSLKIGQFVMDANSCIYAVQNTNNALKVIPALDVKGKQYCPAKNK